MKHKLSLFAVLLMVLTLPNVAKAYDFSYTYQGKTLFYSITDTWQHRVQVDNPTNGNYYSYITGDVVIPDSVENNGIKYAVTCIGYNAFEACSGLTSVTIGNSVTSIGERAFYYCSGLTSVTIGNSVTSIGESAFHYCSGLTSITIPTSVFSIGNDAFYGIRHIVYYGTATGAPWGAYLMNGVIDGDFVYSNNTRDTLIAYIGNDSIVNIPGTVNVIGSQAFMNCSNLTSITIGNSVTSIGERAFRGCSGLTTPNTYW